MFRRLKQAAQSRFIVFILYNANPSNLVLVGNFHTMHREMFSVMQQGSVKI